MIKNNLPGQCFTNSVARSSQPEVADTFLPVQHYVETIWFTRRDTDIYIGEKFKNEHIPDIKNYLTYRNLPISSQGKLAS